jgi:hypothetical protein
VVLRGMRDGGIDGGWQSDREANLLAGRNVSPVRSWSEGSVPGVVGLEESQAATSTRICKIARFSLRECGYEM